MTDRLMTIFLLAAVGGIAGCHNIKHDGVATSQRTSQVSFKVLGMMKAESGAT